MRMIKKLISLPKTIFFNFMVFEFKIAIKLPILIAYNVKLNNLHKNSIVINGDISRFMIRINIDDGSKGVNYNLNNKGFFNIDNNGKIIFNGRAIFASGISIRVNEGELIFGENFSCNKNTFISCNERIVFGDNVLVGWSTNIRDSDGHKVYNLSDPEKDKSKKSVTIGNNVWIAANVDILKGAEVDDNCVIGYRSCLTKKIKGKNCVIAGYPAKIVKTNISWEK